MLRAKGSLGMSSKSFKKFLESEAKKSPFRIEGYINEAEVLKDAIRLACSLTEEDYEAIKEHWRTKSLLSFASILRKYGIDFKGITYMERLMNELSKIMNEQKSQ